MSVNRKYPDDFKFQLVKRYVDGKGTYSSLAKEYGVSHVLLITWVRKYQRGEFAHFEKLQQYEHQIDELQGVVKELVGYQVAASVP